MSLRKVEHDNLHGFIEAWKVETPTKGLWAFPFVVLIFPAICMIGDVNILLSTFITVVTSAFSFCFYLYSKKKITKNKDMFFLTLGIFSLLISFNAGYSSYAIFTDRYKKYILFLFIYLIVIGAVLLFTILFVKLKIVNGYFLETRKPASSTAITIVATIGAVIGTSMSSYFSRWTQFTIIGLVAGLLCFLMELTGIYCFIKYYCCCIVKKEHENKKH